MDEKFIKKELTLNIQNNQSMLDEDLFLYRHDKNIDIFITVNNLKFDFLAGKMVAEDLVYKSSADYFSLRILKPSGKEFTVELMPTVNNRVCLTIEEDFMDDLDEIGTYQLQISLHGDMYGESRITIPPVTFEVYPHIYGNKAEIKGSYGENEYYARVINENSSEDDVEIIASIMGETKVVKSSLVSEQYNNRMELKDGTRLYEWYDKDFISNERMNAIHNFILSSDEDIREIQDDIKDIPTMQNEIDVLQTDVVNIRNALNKNMEAKDVLYLTTDFTNVEQALNHLLYKDMEIRSFTCNASSTIKEYGAYFQNVTFYWEYNKNVTSHTFYGEKLSNLKLREYTYKPAFNAKRTFTLVATDGKTTTQKSITFDFYKRIYWGTTANTVCDTVLISQLQNSELNNKHRSSITVNAEKGQYIYYAVPTEFASCKFSANGFVGGMTLVAQNIQHINVNKMTVKYNIYRSDNHSLGNTTINIL